MTGPFADRLFRITFTLAGFYNLAFGLWAGIWPLAFFELFDIAPPRYPNIWACVGMVVGVYGLLYWHAAWKLDTGWPIIAVGLLGKVLGPIGMVMSFSDTWPRRLGMVCIYNDLIWWLPFGLFLVRGTPIGKWMAWLAPWFCVATHAAALVMLGAFLNPGTLREGEAIARGQYIAGHVTAWTMGWAMWMLAAMSLVGFYAWWGSQVASRKVAVVAVMITALGMVCDFSGEGTVILRLVERVPAAVEGGGNDSWDAAPFTHVERHFTLLSAGAANGLYTIGGMLLMLVTPGLPRWVRSATWITWLAAGVMTTAAVMNHAGGMVVSSAVLFPPLLCWTAWMGARWRPI